MLPQRVSRRFQIEPQSFQLFADTHSGPLTVTDANLFLGRLITASFPSIFGPDADQPLDAEIVAIKFAQITAEFNEQTGKSLTPEEVALGFLNVSNETMSRPIRNTTEARGYSPEKHDLVSFGGAGGRKSPRTITPRSASTNGPQNTLVPSPRNSASAAS